MSTKWAQIADPHMPARDFARTVLSERMEVVESLLPRAAHHYADDVEHVHQLRVGCRRAAAALGAFEPLFCRKPKKLRKWLSVIRDAAGPARDIDVLLLRFGEEADDAVAQYAIKRLKKERRIAQKRLVNVAQRAVSGKLDEAVEKTGRLLTARQHKNRPRVDGFGRHAVHLAYLPFARLAHQEDPTPAELHQLRIAGKRLRYSLEIFRDLCPELLEKVYALVEELQSRLGEINDHATAQALYQSWLAEVPPEALAADLAGRVIDEHKSLAKLRAQFVRWWSAKRIARIDASLSRFCG